MQRAERLIHYIKTAKLSDRVDDPPVWQIEKTRFQSTVCRLVFLPLGSIIVFVMRYMQSYRIKDLKEVRRQFREIWKEKERTGTPMMICANHLTFIDSAIIMWALANNFWYTFNFRALTWNVPAGDFFKKKFHYHAIMYLTKCIFIDREGSPLHKNLILNLCRYMLDKGNVVLIFPEGQRSRTGHFDVDRLRFGPGKILTALDNAQVLCVHVRSPQQKTFSNYPPKGSQFQIRMKVITPSTEGQSKKQASITAVKEIGAVIKEMEDDFFASNPNAKRNDRKK